MVPEGRSLVLFDGVCNVCNAAVLFVIDRDPNEHFVFAPLQSEQGRAAMLAHGLDAATFDSMVLITPSRAYTHSDAALQIARRLTAPWRFFYALWLVPRALRDLAYKAFARRRYALFGQSETCRIPTPALRRRFLN